MTQNLESREDSSRSFSQFLWDLGFDDPFKGGDLDEQIRVRINSELRRELDRTRACIVSAGYDVSRSDIIRVALTQFVESFRHNAPSVAETVLPEERRAAQGRETPVAHPA